MAGRNTICTPQLTREICEVLRGGNYVVTACDYVGLSESAYYEWHRRGREELERIVDQGLTHDDIDPDERPFVEFMESTTRARATAEVQSVRRIRSAAEEDWRADAWFLEHSFPERWGKKRLDVTTDDQAIEFVVSLGTELREDDEDLEADDIDVDEYSEGGGIG